MADKFARYADSASSPARELFTITPHATNEVMPLPKAIRAGSAGSVVLQAADSAVDVTITMAAGEILPVRARFVRPGGTTVTPLFGLA